MIYIAHRGNINGKNTIYENTTTYIKNALEKNLNVEIDVWLKEGHYFLGHDYPQIDINEDFLLQKNLWVHAKNIEALAALKDKCNCFFHNQDDYTLTSKNFIWVYPGKKLLPNCIAVLPETSNYTRDELKQCYAICTDNVINYYD